MRWQLLANALLFQLGWAACILAAQQPWWLLAGLACLTAQLWLSDERLAELRLLLIVTLLGSLLDSLLLNLGLFDFAGDSWLLPAWLALLWALLATTLRHSLAWTAGPGGWPACWAPPAARFPTTPVRNWPESACRWAPRPACC